MTNKHGLSRYIPSDIARQVRQHCGFGCVICGASIFEYEHVDPPFADAQEHNADKITLLCPQCHGKVTRKFLSKETVKEAMKQPFCTRSGFASEFLDIGRVHPKVVFAGQTLSRCIIPIRVKGVPLFQISKGEEIGSPFRLSANFYNSQGNSSLQIIDNEWRAFESNWDVDIFAGVITIRDAPGHISLQLKAAPPDGIIVERLDMLHTGIHFIGNSHQLNLIYPNGGGVRMTRSLADNCHVGLSL